MAQTKINSNQVDLSNLTDVWTPDNLKAGSNISITETPNNIVSPSKTLVLLHFDDAYTNAGSATLTKNGTVNYNSNAKFGKSLSISSGNVYYTGNIIPNNKVFTYEFWFYGNQGLWASLIVGSGYTDHIIFSFEAARDYALTVYGEINGNIRLIETAWRPSSTEWNHIAITSLGDNNFLLHGNGQYLGLFTKTITSGDAKISFNGATTCLYDEAALFNYQRYTDSDFQLQTEAYVISSETPATAYQINANLSSKQNVLTSATGYDATKTQVLKNINGVLTWVDEA